MQQPHRKGGPTDGCVCMAAAQAKRLLARKKAAAAKKQAGSAAAVAAAREAKERAKKKGRSKDTSHFNQARTHTCCDTGPS